MTRATNAVVRKQNRKHYRELAKGFRSRRKNCHRIMVPAVQKALLYAYDHRKQKKTDFRQLWIQRINGALKTLGTNYSKFIFQLKSKSINLNKKVLATIAYYDINSFNAIVKEVIS